MTIGCHVHAFWSRSVNGLLLPIDGQGLATSGLGADDAVEGQ
jgi:hypothetical protein